jgi:hypothetical protein
VHDEQRADENRMPKHYGDELILGAFAALQLLVQLYHFAALNNP